MIPLAHLPGSPWTVRASRNTFGGLRDVAMLSLQMLLGGDSSSTACSSFRQAALQLDVRRFLSMAAYVTGKPRPGDFDACWGAGRVDPTNCWIPVPRFCKRASRAESGIQGRIPSSMMCRCWGEFVDFVIGSLHGKTERNHFDFAFGRSASRREGAAMIYSDKQ